jgi:hypothetical protein
MGVGIVRHPSRATGNGLLPGCCRELSEFMTFNRVMEVIHTDRARASSVAVDASTWCPSCGAAIHFAPGTTNASASSEHLETPHQPNDQPWLYTVEEAAVRLLIGRTKAYRMAGQYLASGGRKGMPVIRLGRCLRVPAWALWVLASTGEVVSLAELAHRRRSTGRRIAVRRRDRAKSGAARQLPPSDVGHVRRRRSPGGRRSSVEQLVLVPGD